MPFPLHERPSEDDLGSLTKAELQDQAAALDISGRSHMDKEELIDAIRAARAQDVESSTPVVEEYRPYSTQHEFDR